jgi:hypothetical protein
MIAQGVYLKLAVSANRERFLHNHWDLSSHGCGEKRLPETTRPGLISTVRSDLPQPSHGLVKEDTLGGIFFLRLKTRHLRPKHGFFNRSHYTLLATRT